MPKLSADDTAEQEGLENIQSCMGNALVYLKLVDLRLRLAAGIQANLLDPAIDDLSNACALIHRAQLAAGRLTPTISRARFIQ